MKFRRIVKEDIGGSFHDPWIIKKICERGRVTQEDIDSVKKWYDYEMRFPNPFMQNAHVMKDLCEDIFNMWEHRGGLNERQMQEVEKHILEGKRTHLSGLQEYLKALVSIASIMVADNADLRDGYDESTSREKIMNKLKKLNITKERFEKSKYFTNKYGKLKYVSESGRLFKTSKGKVLKFNESHDDEYLGIPGTMYITRQGNPGFGPRISYNGTTFSEDGLWNIVVKVYQKEEGKYPRNYDVLETWLHEDPTRMDEVLSQMDAAVKMEKVDESASDIANDPAYECPYCGSHDCEFEDAEEIGTGMTDGYFDGATFNAQFWCKECEKPYNVTFELKVADVYPSDEENQEENEYI